MKPQADQLDQLFPYPVGSLLEVMPEYQLWASTSESNGSINTLKTYILLNPKVPESVSVVSFMSSARFSTVRAAFMLLGTCYNAGSRTMELTLLLPCGTVVATCVSLANKTDPLGHLKSMFKLC